VLRSRTLDEMTGASVALKAENLQRVGAFKMRGAYNHIASLTEQERSRGVVTASSGNHAQAVALAARLLGTTAVVLMPEDAPPNKRAATEGYGAEVQTFDRYTTDRDALLAATASERGLHPVRAYDDDAIVAGQGTVALELIEDAGELDVLIVCLGGGGLISGCALVAKSLDPRCAVIGVEPEDRPAARRALEAGHPVDVPIPRTIADGQQTASIGHLNHQLIARYVDAVVGVSDAEIVAAMRLLFERLKVVVEPSGASALAALLSGRVDAAGKRVGVTLSGGNVDPARFARLVTESAA
jgi:threo-3-hydroxy-L-aspartate ammonia-lyase